MINHNLLLYSLFDRTFEQNFNGNDYTVNYTEGDLFELNKKLLLSTTKYPIIWLQTGYEILDSQMGNKIELQNCKFFLITKGDHHDFYKKRFETNYEGMLLPLYEKFKNIIRKTKGIEIITNPIKFVELPFNDVTGLTAKEGNKREPENATVTDIWDAIVINGINIKINEDCFPQFKI